MRYYRMKYKLLKDLPGISAWEFEYDINESVLWKGDYNYSVPREWLKDKEWFEEIKEVKSIPEHEMLLWICSKIWYHFDFFDWSQEEEWEIFVEYQDIYKIATVWERIETEWVKIDVREIIFNPKFMHKYTNISNKHSSLSEFAEELLCNLENPTQYLYDTLWLWTK